MPDIFQAYDLTDSEAGDESTHYEVFGKHGFPWYYSGSFDDEASALAAIQRWVQAGERREWIVYRVTRRLVDRVKIEPSE